VRTQLAVDPIEGFAEVGGQGVGCGDVVAAGSCPPQALNDRYILWPPCAHAYLNLIKESDVQIWTMCR